MTVNYLGFPSLLSLLVEGEGMEGEEQDEAYHVELMISILLDHSSDG